MRHFSKHLSNEILEEIRLFIEAFAEKDTFPYSKPVRGEASSPDESTISAPSKKAPLKAPSKRAFKSGRHTASEKTVDELIIHIPDKEPSFCKRLFEIIDMKGLKDSAVYKKAGLDRRLFSKLRSDFDYHPSKSTALRLCLALELDIAETEILLESAGYCLSFSDTADLVIRYCIEHKIFDIVSVNEAIDYFSGKLI